MKKKTWIILLIIIALGVGGYFGLQAIQDQRAAATAANFQTETIKRGNLTAIVGATGTVRSNQTAMLSWQTTGIIGELFAEVDDTVKKDDLLARLDLSSLPQNIILAEADLVAARQNLDNLVNSSLTTAQAQLNLANAQDALEKAQNRRESKDYQRASDQTIEEAYANYILAKNEADKWEQRYDNVDDRPEDDPTRAAALSEWAAAKQVLARAEANYRYLLTEPDQLEIALADANLAVAQAQLDDAKRNYEKVKDGADPDNIAAAKARIAALEATLDFKNITAPFSGTITNVMSKPGDQVAPGTMSFRLDDLSRLLVDVEIPEVDINRVTVGMPARITFDAILDQDYNGKVIEVARVGNVVAGVVNFTVTIELQDADEKVLPGMTAAVNIVVNEIENVLVVPNRAVRLRDGVRVVYVLKSGQLTPTPVEIQIGAISDLQSEIIGGDVKEGDVIVLNPPTEFDPGGMGGRPF